VDVDPILVLRKTIRLLESLAAREQGKGDRANLSKMADAMARAADLSVDLAGLEQKLGISHQPAHPGIQVELVRTDAQFEAMKAENAALRLQLEAARKSIETAAGAVSDASGGMARRERRRR
jgi:hypothetical protein